MKIGICKYYKLLLVSLNYYVSDKCMLCVYIACLIFILFFPLHFPHIAYTFFIETVYCIQKACIESPLSIVSSSSGCGTSITNISCGTGSVELDLPRVHATYHSFHQPWELESSKQLYCQTDIVPIKVYIYFINYIFCYHHVLLLLSISELLSIY